MEKAKYLKKAHKSFTGHQQVDLCILWKLKTFNI